ncbi:MAG: 3-oxoadipate enol-lactonase / 4-carboxymuconolactone decarboxylase [Nocardioidaceae bacterium]|nr:3-oxoadipate enol-lactonase / 4-carboxymuconolactone decarboxylase [Nocardioidaceae bacterium]
MSRPTLVLGPSLGTSSASLWGPCAELLQPDFDLHPWDLPGHGENRAPIRGEVTVPDLGRAVLSQLEGPFWYAGDSVGGAVGLQLALDAPDRVLGAVLCCTGARIGTPRSWVERAELVRRAGTSALVAASSERWFGPGFVDVAPQRASELLRALSDADPAGYVAVCGALAGFDVRERLGDVTVPVLTIAGSYDVVTPPETLREIADGVRDGRYVELDGVAHLAPAEAPEQVAALIREHCLARTERTA